MTHFCCTVFFKLIESAYNCWTNWMKNQNFEKMLLKTLHNSKKIWLTQNVHSFVLKFVQLTFCYHGLTQNELFSPNLRQKNVSNNLFLTNDYDHFASDKLFRRNCFGPIVSDKLFRTISNDIVSWLFRSAKRNF
jgi:hypothetical protein